MGSHQETEYKFEIDRDEEVPRLEPLAGVSAVTGPRRFALDAVYFDTADLSLLRRGITLRRRTGGKDPGWHLKRPDPSDPSSRDERQVALGATEPDPAVEVPVPGELQDAITAIVRGQPVVPIVRIATVRREYELVGPDGARAATLADDLVEARSLQGTGERPMQWREIEVELDRGRRRLLDAAGELLEAGGAERSRWPSKLARAATAIDQGPAGSDAGKAVRAGRRGTGAATVQDLVFAHLAEQVHALTAWDPKVREGNPEAVHKMRVATRRLRSALATFRPLLDRQATDPLRDELKWIGGVLGTKRDADVLTDRLRAAREELPTELVLGPVADRITREMGRRQGDAADRLEAALHSTRYFDLLDALDDLLAVPPVRPRAKRGARRGSRKPLRRAVHRVEKAVAEVERAAQEPERLVALHDLRKAAKRARYAAEAAEPAWGKPAKRLATRMRDLQDLLGEHQDTVDSRAALRQFAVNAYLAHENGFTFGLLHEREAQRSADALADLSRATRRALKAGRRQVLA